MYVLPTGAYFIKLFLLDKDDVGSPPPLFVAQTAGPVKYNPYQSWRASQRGRMSGITCRSTSLNEVNKTQHGRGAMAVKTSIEPCEGVWWMDGDGEWFSLPLVSNLQYSLKSPFFVNQAWEAILFIVLVVLYFIFLHSSIGIFEYFSISIFNSIQYWILNSWIGLNSELVEQFSG